MELRRRAYKGFDINENNRLYCQPDKYREYYSIGEIKEINGPLAL